MHCVSATGQWPSPPPHTALQAQCCCPEEVSKDTVLSHIKSGDMKKVMLEVSAAENSFSAKSFMDGIQEEHVEAGNGESMQTPKPKEHGKKRAAEAVVVKTEDESPDKDKKRKLWDKERAIHDEKLKLERAFESFQEGVDSCVNDVNAALAEAKGLAETQPAVYKPRVETLETRANCLLALVAAGEERTGK